LWYAYAETLLALGRDDRAREWFVSAASIDNDGVTDAAERLLELDGIVLVAEDGDEFDADEDEFDPAEDGVDAADDGDGMTGERPAD
jgi:hypothetical protein